MAGDTLDATESGNSTNMSLGMLLDRNQVLQILSSWCDLVGFAAGVVDADGSLFVFSHWQPICAEFHRKRDPTNIRCLHNDRLLLDRVLSNSQAVMQRCPNGLIHIAAPIIVSGQSLGCVFIGQFLLEPPDEDFFRTQARQCGFDEAAYLACLQKVPVVSQEQLPSIMRFLSTFAVLLAQVAELRVRDKEHTAELSQQTSELTKANGALRESQERLEFAVQGGQLGMWDWHPQSGKVIYNDYWAQMLGYEPGEIAAHLDSFRSRIHPDDLASVLDRIQVHLEGKQAVYESEHRLREKSGGWKWVLDRGKVVERDSEGHAIRVAGVVTDITGHKRTEDSLRESREYNRTLFADSSLPLVVMDPETMKFVDANTAAWRHSGFAAQGDLLGKTLLDVSPARQENGEDSSFGVKTNIQTCIERGHATFEWQLVRPSGEPWIGEVYMSRMQLEGKTSIQLAFQDITERKRAEAALHRQLAFDVIVTKILARFASDTGDQIDEDIHASLGEIADFLEADYGFVAQTSPDVETWSVTHGWEGKGMSSRLDWYQNVPLGMFSWMEKRLLAGEFVEVHTPDDFPPEAAKARTDWQAAGFVSEVIVPLRSRGAQVKGGVGIICARHAATWSQDDIQRLQIVGNAIAGILERKWAEDKISQQLRELQRWYEVTKGREGRVRSLKQEVNQLLGRLGEPARYPTQIGKPAESDESDSEVGGRQSAENDRGGKQG